MASANPDFAAAHRRLAEVRYRAGTAPLDGSFSTEMKRNAAEEQHLLAQAQTSGALINLGKMLGGGGT